MKTLEIELPDVLAARPEELVEASSLTSQTEMGVWRWRSFRRRRPFELQMRFQCEDVAWAPDLTGEAG